MAMLRSDLETARTIHFYWKCQQKSIVIRMEWEEIFYQLGIIPENFGILSIVT